MNKICLQDSLVVVLTLYQMGGGGVELFYLYLYHLYLYHLKFLKDHFR